MNISGNNGQAANPKPSINETIFQETVKALYLALPASIGATIVIGILLVSILWQSIDTTLLLVWLSILVSISLGRLISYKLYLKSKKNIRNIIFWDRLFYFLLVLTGLTWSCVSIWLLPDDNSVYHYIPALILIGISAGAVISLGFSMRNITTYYIFLLIPLLISEMLIASFLSYVIAFLIVVFITLALSNTKRINQKLIENISLRYESEEREQELIESKDAAIAANTAKTNFISMISHELRTPLNAILGFSQLLRMSDSPELNEEQDDQTQGIIDSGKHLLSLIEELLDLSRIEAHKLKLVIESIPLGRVLDESIVLLNPVASQYHIEIINNIKNIYLLKADSKRLKQVFINLISNAIKYNHENGKVTINIDESPDSMVRISVTDTGNGLTEQQIAGLFQPFHRYDNKKEGIGLGLYITQNLVELMEGKIGVESIPGKGSTFWFELKLEETVIS